ncbi:Flagellar hook-associated protein 2 [compost metagenome]
MVDGKPATVNVEITAQEDSLAKIAAKINQANAGVTATVLRDHTGERLSLQSNATGANAGFSIAVAQTTGTGLEQFAYDGTDAAVGVVGMSRSREAVDTLATINGIEMRSRNNTFTDVAEGVNLTVAKAMADTEAPVRITIKNDAATAKAAIKNLVDSYNALSGAMSIMTAYDPATKTAGTLQGDSTAGNLQAALRRMLSGPGGQGGAFSSLSQMGLEFQSDGSLKMDDTKLDKALEDSAGMTQFFAADLPGTDQDGWAVRLKDFTTGLLSSEGVFATKDTSFKESIKRNTKDQERVVERASAVEKRLLAQYTRLDMTMANLSALDNYVSQQVTSWNNQKN